MTQRHDPERTSTQLDRVIDAALRELVEREAPHDLHSQIMRRVGGRFGSGRSTGGKGQHGRDVWRCLDGP